jgi:hypothetical protein
MTVMSNSNRASKIDRATVLMAAAKIGCSPPVAEKILVHGASAARNRVHRERGQQVRIELGLDTDTPTAA